MKWQRRPVKCWGEETYQLQPGICDQHLVLLILEESRREDEDKADEDAQTLNDIKSTQNFVCCFSQDAPSGCFLYV